MNLRSLAEVITSSPLQAFLKGEIMLGDKRAGTVWSAGLDCIGNQINMLLGETNYTSVSSFNN